ncbi:UNVERIFIED_CONTAM: protein ENHANCED DISEASE RESISTANCE 4 [Sesamum latifolium]|uniref:Protein ENHANCED DISEASE RESISTANCE 4 n=1 Tax=Sesamum latifolium TaxID=2727402 RepID=A0AAW2SNH1_9LAMI
MAVASDVRLVRCPKCENLLPELPDFSLYQCGGCGAVLKAKKNGFLEDRSLKISNDVEGIGTSEAGDRTNVSEVPMESADVIERGRVAYIHNERDASNGSSMSQAESADVVSSSNARKKGKERMRRREDLDDEYSSYSQGVHNRNEGRNGDLKVDRPEYVSVHSEDTFNNIRPPIESLRSRPFTDTQGVKSKGPLSYNSDYYYEQGDRRRYPDHDWDGLSRVEKSENGRAELLRKLDELKDQLSRSCEVTERSKGRIGTNQRMGSPTFPDPYPRHHAAYLQEGDSSYPLRGHPYEFQGYADTLSKKCFRGCITNRNLNTCIGPIMSILMVSMTGSITTSLCYTHMKTTFTSRLALVFTAIFRTLQVAYFISPQPLTLNSTDVDSENELNHQRPRKVVVAHRSGQVCQPIAGELGNKGFTMSVSAHLDRVPTEIDYGSSGTVDENVKIFHGGSNGANRKACSDDYDDSVPQFPPIDQKSNSGESEKLLGHLSSTLSISEDEKIPENLASKNHSSLSAEPQLTEVESFQHPDFPSGECPDHCYDDVVVSRFDKGNKSKRSEFDPSTSEHNSVNNSAVATEMDMSLNEFSNSCVSQDSMDKSGEAHPMVNKGTESFFTGLIKKGFKDFTKPKQNVEVGGSQVFVNGHLIPDHLFQKAEKLAGPVQPGEYWYDIQAGFWGVMGHPCLGIVMPNIEEFNYPMPEKCAAGNTGVFVNGRELHQKDLDLLVSRGLPETRHKSYLIEISGKVVDEHNGEELSSLGKLAPTVERAKHGFGMRVPRFIAQSQS